MNDRLVVRIVVITLAAVVLGVVAGTVLLSMSHTPVPDPLTHAGDVALGALAAVLVSVRSQPDAPAPVEVVNPPEAPLPTTEVTRPLKGRP